jgi:hypothetical protein
MARKVGKPVDGISRGTAYILESKLRGVKDGSIISAAAKYNTSRLGCSNKKPSNSSSIVLSIAQPTTFATLALVLDMVPSFHTAKTHIWM